MRRGTAIVATLVVSALLGFPGTAHAAKCKPVEPELVAAIEAGVKPGLTLSNVYAVRSKSLAKGWMVSADLDGPGLAGPRDIATWAANKDEAPFTGLIFSVDAVAKEFSDWGRPRGTISFSLGDHGFSHSRKCAKG